MKNPDNPNWVRNKSGVTAPMAPDLADAVDGLKKRVELEAGRGNKVTHEVVSTGKPNAAVLISTKHNGERRAHGISRLEMTCQFEIEEFPTQETD